MYSKLSILVCGLVISTTQLRAQNEESRIPYFPGTLLENAWQLNPRQTFFASGLALEEDSGDFPTTKITILFGQAITSKWSLRLRSQLARFNIADKTNWGGTDLEIMTEYQFMQTEGARPAIQIKTGAILPAGGLASANWNGIGGVNFSWEKDSWGFHLGGQYGVGAVVSKGLGISEADRWRVAGGASFSPQAAGWSGTLAVAGAQPVRPKPVEWTLEPSIRYGLGRFALTFGAAGGLRQKGVDWLFRVALEVLH